MKKERELKKKIKKMRKNTGKRGYRDELR